MSVASSMIVVVNEPGNTTPPERAVDAWLAAYLAREFSGVALWALTQRTQVDFDLSVKRDGRGRWPLAFHEMTSVRPTPTPPPPAPPPDIAHRETQGWKWLGFLTT